MLSAMVSWFFGCSHGRTSFPMTLRHANGSRKPSKGMETYVVCFDCGKRLAYDWTAMRIAKQPATTAKSNRAEEGIRMRAPLPTANRLLQRLVHHT